MPNLQSLWLPMGVLSSVTLSSVLAHPGAPTKLMRDVGSNATIQWGPCKTINNVTVTFSCGVVTVPLDYTDPSNQTIDLNVVKLPAAKQPAKSSILMNPGGPGASGRNSLWTLSSLLQAVLGDDHDIISWDPRGTGVTLPFSCYANNPAAQAAYIILKDGGFTTDTTAYDTNIGVDWAVQGSLAKACGENATAYGELIGTAFAARDMMAIVDALGEDGLLRYWGFSYGTALGATAAAMFPERVDKVLLDGVLNPTQYYEGRDLQQGMDSDAVLEGFVTGCKAAPGLCPLARWDKPEKGLLQQINGLLQDLKQNPLVFGGDLSTDLVTYGFLKAIILNTMYQPLGDWQPLAMLLDGILSRNASAYNEGSKMIFAAVNYPFENLAPVTSENTQGVRCSDTSLRTNNLTSLMPLIDEMSKVSALSSGILLTAQTLTCPQWPFKAKEVYSGGFNNITTRRPLLFVGNTFDPVTSLSGARNSSAGFVGSRLLVNDGYGHTTTGQPSICTAKHIRAYFNNGTLPDEDTVCEMTVPTFTNISYVEALAPLNSNSMA